MTFITDAHWIRPRNRHLLLAGSPWSLSRVTDVGVSILDAIDHGNEPPDGHQPLTDRLVMSGALHRSPSHGVTPSDITVVVPAHITSSSDAERTQQLIDALAPLRVVVVDDASPVAHPLAGCEIVRHGENMGPAAARNTGASHVLSPVIAFVDSDAMVGCDDIVALAGHLVPNETAVVAPRVVSRWSRGVLARYERMSSTLDMGTATTRVRSGARVPYVPSTCLVIRTDTFNASDGFDPSLRYGEDVDFIWRAINAGVGVKYVADVQVTHAPRATIGGFVRQRFAYGTSAAPLARRHGVLAAPYRGDVIVAASWVTLCCGWWYAAAALCAFAIGLAALQLGRKGVDVVSALRVVVGTWILAGRRLADAVTKPWLVVFLAASVASTRIAIALATAFVVPAVADYLRRPRTDPISFLALRAIEHASYGCGVLWSAIRAHSPTAMLPSLTLRR